MKKLLIICSLLITTSSIVAEEATKSCFRVQDVHDWKALDNKRLIVWSPSQSHPYLITLMNYCPSLLFEQTLVFKSTLSRTCSDTKDVIFTRDIPCYIQNIQKTDEESIQKITAEIEGTKS